MSSLSEHITEYSQRAADLQLKIDCNMHGALHAEIAIVGEAPSHREVQTKLPISGGIGDLIWSPLRKLGMNRNNVYTTHAVKRNVAIVGHARSINAGELQKWQQLLTWELAQLPNLKYILILGDYSLQALLGVKGVTNWRGSVLPITTQVMDVNKKGRLAVSNREYTGVVTYNPLMVLRKPSLEPVLHMDLAKLQKVSQGTWIPHEVEPIINPSPKEAIDWCDKMIDEKIPVAFDIEVISNESACIGLANSTTTGMCINWRNLESNRWSSKDEQDVRRSLGRTLTGDNCRLVAQNGSFDSYYLWYKDKLRVSKVWFDTMLAHHLLYPGLPHGLGFLTTQYTRHPYYKDEGKNWREGGNIDQFWNYNVKDCCLTLAASQRMEEELKAQGLDEFFYSHIMRLQTHLVRMTVGGVLMDTSLKDHVASSVRAEVEVLKRKFQKQCQKLLNDDEVEINPNSPIQLSRMLFTDLHLPSKGKSVDKNSRSFIRNHPRTSRDAKVMLETLDKYATENKFLTTYAEMKLDEDDRIRCEYKQTGVQSAPGRLSSSSVLWGSGTNLQNQPHRAYEMFIADRGYRFAYFDLAQAEARVVAWLAGIGSWIEQFERARVDGSFDAHRALAADMFKMEYAQTPSSDENPDGTPSLRYIAKRCRHGLNYRMQAAKLAEVTGQSLSQATENYNIYHRTTPELKQWWQNTIDEVKATRELWSPLGRRLKFLGRMDENALDSVIAFKPQSTIGDLVASFIYKIEDHRRWPINARVCLNIHDALIALVPKNKAKMCLTIMKEVAEQPIMVNNMPLIIPADMKLSEPDDQGIHRWSTLKDVTL